MLAIQIHPIWRGMRAGGGNQPQGGAAYEIDNESGQVVIDNESGQQVISSDPE